MNVIRGHMLDGYHCLVRQVCVCCGRPFTACTDIDYLRHVNNPLCDTCHDAAHEVNDELLDKHLREGSLDEYYYEVRRINHALKNMPIALA